MQGIAELMRTAGVEVGAPLHCTQIAGGRSNLTYRLSDGRASWVVRMPPRAGRTPSAHDVAREFRVMKALSDTDVPVARPILLCEDERVIGLPFTVVDFVYGTSVQSQVDLAALDDTTTASAIRAVVETLASLHRVDHAAVGLDSFGRASGYADRQLRRWGSQWELVSPAVPHLDSLAAAIRNRLAAAVPDQTRSSIVHGDYRIDNTMLELQSSPVRVAAVLDWELSTIGDPIADVAMMCAYRHPALDLIMGFPSAWTSARLPSPEALLARYELSGGASITNWEFHLSLAYFKIAVIAAGIDHRYRAGAVTGDGFRDAVSAVAPLLEQSLETLGVF
ncbi:phosphotransferase family protein [Nocardia jiangxiensis]